MKTVKLCVSKLNGGRIAIRGRSLPVVAGFVLAMYLSPAAPGAELTVGQSGGADHTTVQAAIVAAGPGDTITILDSATYAEDVSIGALVPPVGPNGRPNLTLQAAVGERPTIQAVNTEDRFGQGVADFNGLLVMSEGVTLKGLNILNSGDASGAVLGLATALSIQAGNVTVIDCDISMAGGVVAPNTSVTALVSDLGVLGGLPSTVDNVLFTDCTIHDGTRIGMAVFPVAFALAPIAGSVLNVSLDGCVFRDNAGPGFEADGLGSITLTDVTVETGGGNGMELAMELMTLTDCASLSNSGSGIVVSPPDQVAPGTEVTMVLNAGDLICSDNGSDGLTLAEGTAVVSNLTCLGNGDDGLEVQVGPADIANLVSATNGSFNLNFAPLDDFTLTVDHATLYNVPGDPTDPPNLQIDAGGKITGPRLVIKNSILVGPVTIFNYDDLPVEDFVFDTSMFWNGGAAIASNVEYTVTGEVASVDPLLVDPSGRDFRLMATSPVANADDQGGPLGGAGIVSALPDSITIGAAGISGGQFFLEWEGTPNVTFDVRGGADMDSSAWPVIESVPGTAGTQHWDDTRPTAAGQFYGIKGRLP